MGWFVNSQGEIEFSGGREDWARAARLAADCPAFALDAEEELVAEETSSCYNCRYRRWTVEAFVCCRQAPGWDREAADPG